MFALLCVVACGLANIAVGWSMKGAQNSGCRTAYFGICGNAAALLIAAATLPFFDGPRLVGGVWLIGLVLGGLFSASLSLGVLANLMGPPSVAWSMANMGLLVPIGLCCLFGEALRGFDAVMLLAFVLMLAAFQRGMTQANDVLCTGKWRYALLLAVIFVVNGLLMFCFKLNSLLYPTANKGVLLVGMYAGALVIFTLSALLRRRKSPPAGQTWVPALKWGGMLGASIGVTQLLLQASMALPAVIVFPLVQGLSLMGGVLLMAVIYREKFNPPKTLGLMLGLLVLILSVLR